MTDDVRREALPMNPDPSATIDAESTPHLHLEWSDEDTNDTYVNDLIGSAEQVGDDATEPQDALALACSAAIASTALGKALNHQWALYTPQDAAVVASALHAQLAATVDNLRKLARAVECISERNEVDLPEMSGLVTPEEENASDALDRLGGVADELEPNVEELALAVATLHRTPALFQPSPNVHENLHTVVELLEGDVKITGYEPGEDHQGEECRCVAVITRGTETYYLSYNDMSWSLLRDSDAVHRPDGRKSWVNGGSIDIRVHDPLVHPRQLAEEVAQAIGDAAHPG